MALQSMIQKFFDPNDPSTWGIDQGNAPQSSAQVPDAPAPQGSFNNAQPETPAPGSIAAAYSSAAQPQPTPSFDEFKAQNPNAANAYMPPRPVTPFDRPTDAATGKPMTADQVRASSDPNVNTWSNRHTGLRRGLADVFAGLTEYAGDRAGHPGQGVAMVENMNAQDQAQRQYDANAPKLRAAADQQAYTANLGQQAKTADVRETNARANLTDAETANYVGPAQKVASDTFEKLKSAWVSNQYTPEQFNQLVDSELAMQPPNVGRMVRAQLGTIQQLPQTPPTFTVKDGAIQPMRFQGGLYGPEAGANDPQLVANARGAAQRQLLEGQLKSLDPIIRGQLGEPPVDDPVALKKYMADAEKIKTRMQVAPKVQVLNAQNGGLGTMQVPQGVSGEAALSQMDPNTAAEVRMIGDGKADFATFTSRMPPAAKANLSALVHAYNPEFDQATYTIRKGVQEDLTSGGKSNTILYYNTSLKHLDSFLKVAGKLGNGDFTPMNALSQAIGLKFGSDASTNFALARDFFSGEVGKAAAGTNATQGERQQIADQINRASSWTQLQGAAATAKDFLEGKRSAMQHQAEQGLKGKADFGDANNSPTAPAPQTHVFSLGAWKKANPNGDVNAAKAAAQAQGYQVAQ